LPRSNLTGDNPALLWQHYIQLTEVEQPSRSSRATYRSGPVHHQTDARIEAHIFVAFMAYSGCSPHSIRTLACRLPLARV